MSTAVVIGAAGFIGSHVVKEYLANFWTVIAVIQRSTRKELEDWSTEGKITLVKSDATDRDALGAALDKAVGEESVEAEKVIQEALPADRYALIRASYVWGPGDPSLGPRMISALDGFHFAPVFGRHKGRNRGPLIYAKNLATALFLAALNSGLCKVLDRNMPLFDPTYYAFKVMTANRELSGIHYQDLMKRYNRKPISRTESFTELAALATGSDSRP